MNIKETDAANAEEIKDHARGTDLLNSCLSHARLNAAFGPLGLDVDNVFALFNHLFDNGMMVADVLPQGFALVVNPEMKAWIVAKIGGGWSEDDEFAVNALIHDAAEIVGIFDKEGKMERVLQGQFIKIDDNEVAFAALKDELMPIEEFDAIVKEAL